MDVLNRHDNYTETKLINSNESRKMIMIQKHPLLSILPILLITMSSYASATKVNWYDWNKAAFEQAKKEKKMILINVGMEGCAACARMDKFTYDDQSVADIINKYFIPIAVDSEARPDIGERYSDWAWPATAFLSPDAVQVFAMAGNRFPRNFIPILNDLIDKQTKGILKPDPNSPYAAPPKPVKTALDDIRNQIRNQLDRNLNESNGGWSNSAVNMEYSGSRLRHLLFRSHLYGMQNLEKIALKTVDNYVRSIDPVWGGAYEVVFHQNAKVPQRFEKIRAIPEKRISSQANAISGFALAYQLTKDEKYRKAMKSMSSFLHNWFTSPKGLFYTNQKSEPIEFPDNLQMQDYWVIEDDAKRRALGIPPIDHATYTDQNGEMISALVLAFEAFSDPRYKAMAERAAKELLRTRTHKDGWMINAQLNNRVVNDARMRPYDITQRPYLSTQAKFGQALLDLYRINGNSELLIAAQRIADAMIDQLGDSENGGFWGAPLDDVSALIAPRKPIEDNGSAISFLYDLSVYVKEPKYEEIARLAAQGISDPSILRREGKITAHLGLGLEKLSAEYVEFSIVGDENDPAARALYQAANHVYHPRKIVHFEKPGRYPKKDFAAAYICNPNRCSVPLKTPEEVVKVAESYRSPQ